MPFGDWYMDYDYSKEIDEVIEPFINKDKFHITLASEDKIYITSTSKDKPVKIILKELPCPIIPNVRCKCSKIVQNELEINIICTNEGDCELINT